jgi:hypothetical protein
MSSSREILEVLLEPNSTLSFSNCSLNSFSLLTLFLLLSLAAYKVLASNLGLIGIVTNDRLLYFRYVSVVTGSSNHLILFFFINTSSFQSCLMLFMTSKVDFTLNNLENYDSLVVLGIFCIPLNCLATKTSA